MQTDFANWSDDQLELFVIRRDPTHLVRLLVEQAERDVQAELGAIVHYHRAQQLAALLSDYATRKRTELPVCEQAVARAEAAQHQARAILDAARRREESIGSNGAGAAGGGGNAVARIEVLEAENRAFQQATYQANACREALARLLQDIESAEHQARLLSETPRPQLDALRIVLRELCD
ncbi:MAG: hypothetical protein GX552_02260 [Chloroflexi bacterium]|jgi:hypothetical protein|nr:hypothetical protein [Chloroflexota bacterium]